MPISIENEDYEFDLVVSANAAGKTTAEFNLFLEVKNVLVIYPVQVEVEVLPGEQPETAPVAQEEADAEI